MTTTELMAAPSAPPLPDSPADRWRWLIRDGFTIARRDAIHWRRRPGQIVAGLAFPIMFVVLYGYVLGGSMSVAGGGAYMDFLIPGLFTMTMAFGVGDTIIGVNTDVARGVTDRFRSMPISAGSVVLGRALADMVWAVVNLAVLAICGLAVGWRWHGTLAAAGLAFGLLLLLRFSLVWAGIYFGLLARSPEAAASSWALLFPLTMLANTFASPELMPGWLGAIANWNPLSATVTATRELFENPGVGGNSWATENTMLLAVGWPVLIMLIFAPLAVRRYRNRSI